MKKTKIEKQSWKEQYCWKFLSRNSGYQEFYYQSSKEIEAAKNNRKEVELEIKMDLLSMWYLTKLYDPKSKYVSGMFHKSIYRNVVQYVEQPTDTDYLYLKLNPYGNQKTIFSEVSSLLSEFKEKSNIVLNKKMYSIDQLEMYLFILDHYKDFVKESNGKNPPKLFWKEFAVMIQNNFDIISEGDLRKTTFPTAIRLRDTVPLSLII